MPWSCAVTAHGDDQSARDLRRSRQPGDRSCVRGRGASARRAPAVVTPGPVSVSGGGLAVGDEGGAGCPRLR